MSIEPVRGNLYRIRSRNLPYGVYTGSWFIGIREKFGYLYLDVEYGVVLEDLGPAPEDIQLAEYLGKGEDAKRNEPLYDFLAREEMKRGRVMGYGGRPGDPEGE